MTALFILLVLGIGFLLLGIIINLLQMREIDGIYQVQKYKSLLFVKNSILAIILLVVFFISGYVLEILIIYKDSLSENIKKIIESIEEMIPPIVYFGGSLFVFFINSIFYNFVIRLKQSTYSRDYFETLINSSFSFKIITDLNFRITDVNKTFLEKFNLKKEEVIGKSFLEFTSWPRTNIILEKALEYNCFINGIKKDVLFSINLLTIYGEIRGYIISGTDITELNYMKRKIEIERNFLEKFFSPTIVFKIKNFVDEALKKSSDQTSKKNIQTDFQKGEISEGIVCFFDLHNSTIISQKLTIDEFTNLLEKYINYVSQKVNTCGGTIYKIIGDGLLVTFENQNYESFINCLEDTFYAFANKEVFSQELEVGISCHYGKFYKGLIGNESLLDYTILGETVNLAAKLQSVNKKLKKNIILTEKVVEKIPAQIKDISNIKKIKEIYWKYNNSYIPIYTLELEKKE